MQSLPFPPPGNPLASPQQLLFLRYLVRSPRPVALATALRATGIAWADFELDLEALLQTGLAKGYPEALTADPNDFAQFLNNAVGQEQRQ
jgi:hypothetical protein